MGEQEKEFIRSLVEIISDKIGDAIKSLPCTKHGEDIVRNTEKIDSIQSSLKWIQGLIAAVILLLIKLVLDGG